MLKWNGVVAAKERPPFPSVTPGHKSEKVMMTKCHYKIVTADCYKKKL